MKKLIISIFALFNIAAAAAQEQIITIENDENQEVIELPSGMINDTDSLYLDWISKNYINQLDTCSSLADNPALSDSIYINRLKRIPAIIELPYNNIVKRFIEAYSTRLRQKVAFMLSANNFYMPIFEEALDLYGLPLELKYLPVIESALNPMATSRQGASGLWQFMLKTGQIYGLRVNSLIDERRDPIKSTMAAARYLRDLYDIYNDWTLVLAAYNCGPGNVNKAIRRADGKKDYWELYNYLPKETRGYVPAFIAANYIMTYYCEHNIAPMEMRMPEGSDTIHISRHLNLNQVAEVCHINIDELRALNPQYRRDVVPGNEKPYALRLPNKMIGTYLEKEDSIFSHKSNIYNSRRAIAEVKEIPMDKRTYHKIRNGESLGSIARKYRVSINQLRRLNGIKGDNIRAGKTIRIR